MSSPRHMHLALFLGRGGSAGSWRRAGSGAEDLWSLDYYREMTLAAENAKFDAVFRADNPWIDVERLRHSPAGALDPLVLLGALATQTSKIGLVATASSTFSDPYTVARQFASLDHISGGRAGWNLVASERGENNFGGGSLFDRTAKHERSAEFVEVVQRLWDSWEPGAVLADRETGVYADVSRIHRINHEGTHFSIEGPLDVGPTPQGHPVICTTATSPQSSAVAARYADIVYSASPTLESAQLRYRELKTLAAEAGRDPDSLKVMLAVTPFVAETADSAVALRQELAGLMDLGEGLRNAERLMGVPLAGHELDDVLHPSVYEPVFAVENPNPTAARLATLAVEQSFTLRRLIVFSAGANVPIWEPTGSVHQIADLFEEWFLGGACDGFNINPAYSPEGIHLMTDHVAPELARRGLFRTEYEAATLRGHFALD